MTRGREGEAFAGYVLLASQNSYLFPQREGRGGHDCYPASRVSSIFLDQSGRGIYASEQRRLGSMIVQVLH